MMPEYLYQDSTTSHLAGKLTLEMGGGILRCDARVYMYEVSDIRHNLSLTLPLFAIIVAVSSLVNTNIDKNI